MSALVAAVRDGRLAEERLVEAAGRVGRVRVSPERSASDRSVAKATLPPRALGSVGVSTGSDSDLSPAISTPPSSPAWRSIAGMPAASRWLTPFCRT